MFPKEQVTADPAVARRLRECLAFSKATGAEVQVMSPGADVHPTAPGVELASLAKEGAE